MIDIVKLTAIHLDKIHIRTNPVDTTLFPFTNVKLSYIKNVFLPKVKRCYPTVTLDVLQDAVKGIKFYKKDGFEVSEDLVYESQYWAFIIANQTSTEAIYIYSVKEDGLYQKIYFGNYYEFQEFFVKSVNKGKFCIGSLSFDSSQGANEFINNLERNLLYRDWSFGRPSNTLKFPRLKEYIEHTLGRLIYESQELGMDHKIIYNEDYSKIIFCPNLLNKYVSELYIMANVDFQYKDIGYMRLSNPQIVTQGNKQLEDNGFDIHIKPLPPTYFENISDVIFNASLKVDTDDFDHMRHIIEERNYRISGWDDISIEEKVGKLRTAINTSVAIAKSNYKYIVPMYYPSEKRMQFLMPIYFNGYQANKQPNTVLILDKRENSYYRPVTTLTPDEAYNDARLIANPYSPWLMPCKYKSSKKACHGQVTEGK